MFLILEMTHCSDWTILEYKYKDCTRKVYDHEDTTLDIISIQMN
jgi:hypothetical protein